MEAFSKFIAVVILVIFVFLVPLMNVGEKSDTVTQSYVNSLTTDFVENVRKQGRITQDMYNKFIENLSSTGNTYDIEFVHTHTVVNPEYNDDGTITTTTYDDHYYTEEIMSILFGGLDAEYEEEYLKAGKVLGEYRMYKGDYFTVTVKNRNFTLATRLRNVVFRNRFPAETIVVTYGGEIEDENY